MGQNQNRVENLEWCTYKYNSENRRIKSNKSFTDYGITQYDFQGRYVNTYDSINSASLYTDIIPYCIKLCADGIINQAGGYIWKYVK